MTRPSALIPALAMALSVGSAVGAAGAWVGHVATVLTEHAHRLSDIERELDALDPGRPAPARRP